MTDNTAENVENTENTIETLSEIAETSKAWPYEEARKVLKRIKGETPEKGYVLFQTGYGPSGLPHIGTFGEVARTTMVMSAFCELTDNQIPVKLLCFSDDMDGMRKVPDNVPNKDILEKDLHKALTSVLDPFECCDSFAEHNNNQLCAFLDSFGFDYEFASATEYYQTGKFDATLLQVLRNYEKVQNIMLPTLGEERRKTYSPFLPVCPETRHVLQVEITDIDVESGTVCYKNNAGETVKTLVTGGHCKLQWKPDWAMRWVALDVDYEMCGKDLKPSVDVSSKIAKVLDGKVPANLVYELFLDEQGSKISKSKGNGLSIEEWLKYAPAESLSLYMYQKPKTAKKLYFGIIPKAMDEYLTWVEKYPALPLAKKVESPVHHIHGGNVPDNSSPLSFALLLNLATVSNVENKETLWGFINKYAPEATAARYPKLDDMTGFAVQYYQDFIKSKKQYASITPEQRPHFEALKTTLQDLQAGTEKDADTIQTAVFSVGKNAGYENLREWFNAIYKVLLGQEQGPRMGSFFSLYGLDNSIKLIEDALNGDLAK